MGAGALCWARRIVLVVGFGLAAGAGPIAASEMLVININTSDAAPRAAWEAAIDRFRQENRDLDIRLNVYDHESYKKALRNWLTSASPDVILWNVGYRMRQFVEPGLLADVSSLFTPEVKAALGPAAVEQVTVAGRQYGVPYSYYQIGLYYRQDLFQRAGLARPPSTWSELLEACTRLRGLGLSPIAIGSRDLWPTAAWFDYLNLRLNGYRFHVALTDGKVPYTDARIRAVFAKWRELLDRGCFVSRHASISWQESQALIYRDRAAMMLIGNFIVANFPPDLRDRMQFARFPTISPDVETAEEAPMNSLHVPARARNPAAARRFLAYVLKPETQEQINRAMLQLPVHQGAAIADDRFLRAGRALLSAAEHVTQYFDRDTDEALAAVAMKGFQEFMSHPDRLESVLENIERARRRIYERK